MYTFLSKILPLDIIIIKQQFNTTTLMSLFIYCSTEVCGKFLQLFSNFFFKMIKLQYMNHVSLLTLIILFLRNLYPSIIIHQYRYIQSNFKERKKTYSVSWYKLTMRISIDVNTYKYIYKIVRLNRRYSLLNSDWLLNSGLWLLSPYHFSWKDNISVIKYLRCLMQVKNITSTNELTKEYLIKNNSKTGCVLPKRLTFHRNRNVFVE